jgi:hypothetical protein
VVLADSNIRSPATNYGKSTTGVDAMHEPAQFAVGWGTLSLINAGLAQSKGRSGLAWWLVSLFVGPIVLDRRAAKSRASSI